MPRPLVHFHELSTGESRVALFMKKPCMLLTCPLPWSRREVVLTAARQSALRVVFCVLIRFETERFGCTQIYFFFFLDQRKSVPSQFSCVMPSVFFVVAITLSLKWTSTRELLVIAHACSFFASRVEVTFAHFFFKIYFFAFIHPRVTLFHLLICLKRVSAAPPSPGLRSLRRFLREPWLRR